MTVEGDQFSDDELRRGVTITISSKKNVASKWLKPSERVSARAVLVGGQAAIQFQLLGGIEYYFEEGALQILPTFEATDRERQAGFP